MSTIIKKYKSKSLLATELLKNLILFDKQNMKDILEKSDLPFDEKARINNFKNDDTVIIAFNESNEIIGYIEFGPHPQIKDNIYIPSMQIIEKYRNGSLIWELLLKTCCVLKQIDFNELMCNVHVTNKKAIRIYKKLGFSIEKIDGNTQLFRVRGNRSILQNKTLERFKIRTKQ